MSRPDRITPHSWVQSVHGIGPLAAIPSAMITDIVVLLAATELAALARADFDADQVRWEAITVLALFMAGSHLIVGAGLVLYGHRYSIGSFDEMRAVAVSVTSVSAVATVAVLIIQPTAVPRSVPFLAWPLAFLGMLAIRFVKRLLKQTKNLPGRGERILIFGAGWVGSALALRMLRDPSSPFLPVGFLDDDPAKSHLQQHGLRVWGTSADV